MSIVLELLLYASAITCLYMVLIYLYALDIKNFSIVDIAWSAGFTIVIWAIYFKAEGIAYLPRINFLKVMVTLWSLRLAYHLFVRIKKEHPKEEGRYVELRTRWSSNVNRNFFIFFIAQGLSIAILSLPFMLSVTNSNPEISIVEKVAIVLWFISFAGEAISDHQLKLFKKNPSNKGKVCNVGLWNYSRHPNYFFEWMIWVSYFIYAVEAPYGYLGIISPAVILFLLFKITGIPATEKESLRTRGEAYKEYQNSTSVFVPWFKKR